MYMAVVQEDDPLTYEEVLQSPLSKEWKGAIEDELKSLSENGTWEVFPLPMGKKILGTKWVFKTKRNQDNSDAKYKARLTVKGYLQVKDFDFTDTFAPVFKQKTLRKFACNCQSL